MTLTIRRLTEDPIIHQAMSPSIGNNINGPCLVRLPEWTPTAQRLGRYYLYFAHHEGQSIRLAYADDVTGPWHIHEPGALPLEGSLFPSDPATIQPVGLDETHPLATFGVNDFNPHIASPDVQIDHHNQQFRLYYHGMLEDGDQASRVALSSDGLRFAPLPPLIGHYYLRVFEHQDWFYALAWGGYLYRARQPEGPFERGPALFEGAPLCPRQEGTQILRHLAVMREEDDVLHVFYTRIGDAPEVILHIRAHLTDDWHHWRVDDPQVLMRPELAWEGGHLPVVTSRPGVTYQPENALRDPHVFRDHDGRVYMTYCGGAEQAIGIVELLGL